MDKRQAGNAFKALLRKAFPGVTFRVVTSFNNKEDSNFTFAVSWKDGPTEEQVQKVGTRLRATSTIGKDIINTERDYSQQFFQRIAANCAAHYGVPIPIVRMPEPSRFMKPSPTILDPPALVDKENGEPTTLLTIVYRWAEREAE